MDEEGEFVIEHGHAEYAADELLEQAQANAQALAIATAGFLQERGIPVADWAEAVGRRFARTWGEPRPWDAGEFMDAMLTNFRALGAVIVTVELGTERAEAVTTGFPAPDLCALFEVDAAIAAGFNDATAAIARERGLSWAWHLDGEQTRYLAVRAAG